MDFSSGKKSLVLQLIPADPSGVAIWREGSLSRFSFCLGTHRLKPASPGAYFKILSTRSSSAWGSTSGISDGRSVSSQGQRRRPAPSRVT